MKLRWTASTLVLLLSVAAMGTALPQSANEQDARQLERLEQTWNEAHQNGDAEALDKLWADDLEVDVPRMPPMTKKVALNFARSGKMRFSRYATSDLNTRVYGDTAVVTGRLQRTRMVGGKEMSDDWRFTKVYIRRAGQWRVVSFHASESAAQ
jgi:ketosteroid isomerase-like protein